MPDGIIVVLGLNNIFWIAMFWLSYRNYKEVDKQFWKLNELLDERKEHVERLIAIMDKYRDHAQELQHTVDMLKSERISPEDLTQYPN